MNVKRGISSQTNASVIYLNMYTKISNSNYIVQGVLMSSNISVPHNYYYLRFDKKRIYMDTHTHKIYI